MEDRDAMEQPTKGITGHEWMSLLTEDLQKELAFSGYTLTQEDVNRLQALALEAQETTTDRSEE